MSATRVKPKAEDTAPSQPQTPPAMPAYSPHDQSFTLQAIMDLKGSFVEVTTELKNLKSSVDSVKSKVDDLVNWKNKTLGGAIVLGVVATLLGVLVTKASDYISLKTPQAAAAPQPAPTPPGK